MIRKLSFLLSALLILSFPNDKVFASEECRLLDQVILKFNTGDHLNKPRNQPNLDATWWNEFSITHELPIQSVKPLVSGAYLLVIDTKKFTQLSKTKHLSKEDYFKRVLKNLSQHPNIKYADRDMTPCVQPPSIFPGTPTVSQLTDSLISHASQWSYFNYPGVFLESGPGLVNGAWSITFGFVDPPIIISNFEAINYNSDLAPNILTGWNFAKNNTNTTDPTEDHGTHTAGTIAATGTVAGITGIGPQFKILPIVQNSLSTLEEGIYWSMGIDIPGVPHNDYPIKVASMSFGFGPEIPGCPPSLQEALDAFVNNNGTIVVSAGNDNTLAGSSPPQACNNVIVVAATDIEGYRAPYSNYGPAVTIAAPGGNTPFDPCDPMGILSTVTQGRGCQNSGFAFLHGTSMAAPHVAGIAGLLYAVNPLLNTEAVRTFLLSGVLPFAATSDPERSCLGVKSCGAGIVNAFNSVQLAMSGRTIINPPSKETLQLKSALDPFNRCPANLYVPTAQSIASPLPTRWIVNKSTRACQPLSAYGTPTIQVHRGQLFAIYGKTVLSLQTQNLSCQVNHPYGFIC